MRIGPDPGHNRWHPDIVPAARVEPGMEVVFDTEDGLNGELTPSSTHADVATLDTSVAHPLTGPVFVEGAEPGDLLEVEILAIDTPAHGVSCTIPGFGFLADVFTDPYVLHWELDGSHARSAALPGIAVPAVPHPGVMGVAPSHALMERQRAREATIEARGGPVAPPLPEGAYPPVAADGLRTIPPRENGGNIDIRHLVPGAALYLAVHVPGALFSLGDVHFAQGDGEVCGTGIEITASVTVRFGLRKGAGGTAQFPAYLTPAQPAGACYATTGISEDEPMELTLAGRAALTAMIDWLEREHGLERYAAYCLCSACVDLRVCEVVDVPYPLVAAHCPLDIFAQA